MNGDEVKKVIKQHDFVCELASVCMMSYLHEGISGKSHMLCFKITYSGLYSKLAFLALCWTCKLVFYLLPRGPWTENILSSLVERDEELWLLSWSVCFSKNDYSLIHTRQHSNCDVLIQKLSPLSNLIGNNKIGTMIKTFQIWSNG